MDKDTFTKQVLEAETTLYRMSKTILIQDADCEDAVQGAILKAYEKLDSLREEKFFKTWLIRILLNECYSIQNKKSRCISYEEYQVEESTVERAAPENQSSWGECDGDLQQCLMELPEKIRVTIVLYYVEEYSIKEISEILHVPTGTVKSRMAKGRRLLRRELESMEVQYEAI